MSVFFLVKEYIILQVFYVDENLQVWYEMQLFSVIVKLIGRVNDVFIIVNKNRVQIVSVFVFNFFLCVWIIEYFGVVDFQLIKYYFIKQCFLFLILFFLGGILIISGRFI